MTRPLTQAGPAPPRAAPSPLGVATENTPAPWLPGLHFAVALLCLLLGSGGLVWFADDLAAGAFYLPHIAAVTHLFVLGWIMLSIFGALCQFLPVAVGQRLASERFAGFGLLVHTAGLGGFVYGLTAPHRMALYVGAACLSFSFVGFAMNLFFTLKRAKERELTWWALLGAALFLIVTPAYGLVLALNLHGDYQVGERFITVAAHAHVALVGVVLLVMVGVAQRLLPMFLLSHGQSERPGWVALLLFLGGALLLAIPYRNTLVLTAGYSASALGVIALVVQAALFFKHRVRRAIDPGMRLAGAGVIALLTALLMAPFALTTGLRHPPLLSAYFVAMLGAISLFIAGHYLKIVPFIVWYHRYAPLVGLKPVPKVAELYSERLALVSGGLLALGLLGLVAATLTGARLGLRLAAVAFSLGAVIHSVIITRTAIRRAP